MLHPFRSAFRTLAMSMPGCRVQACSAQCHHGQVEVPTAGDKKGSRSVVSNFTFYQLGM